MRNLDEGHTVDAAVEPPPHGQPRTSGRWLFALGGVAVGAAVGFSMGFFMAGYLFTKLLDRSAAVGTSNANAVHGSSPSAFPPPTLSVGHGDATKLAFDTLLVDDQRRQLPLSSFRGKVLFVNVWATYCAPCIAELPALSQLYGAIGNREKFAFISISKDDEPTLQRFLREREIPFPVYRFAPGSEIEGLGTAVPVTLVVDEKGTVIARIVGAANWADKRFLADLREVIERAAGSSA